MPVTATSWKPGRSGNPKGRAPSIDDIPAYARQFGRQAVDTMVQCLRDPKWRLPAAVALLDRGYGRPVQAVVADVNGALTIGGIDAPPPILDETDAEWLARRRAELAQLNQPTPKAES